MTFRSRLLASDDTLRRHSKVSVLFLSLDGLLQPLGRSQIVAYVTGLARSGIAYTVISAESQSDLQDTALVEELRNELRESGVAWEPVEYSPGGALAAAQNLRRLGSRVTQQVQQQQVQLVHARSYIAAGLALACKARFGTPYIFDTRGYWPEEKRASGKWLSDPITFAIAKRLERRLFMGAAGVVGLTQLSIDDFNEGVFGKAHPRVPAVTIPTATNGEAFVFDRSKTPPTAGANLRETLSDKLVIGYVGSVNASYHLGPSIELFKKVQSARPDAHFLGITGQGEVLSAALATAGVAKEDFSVVKARYADMPQWLSCIDWGLLLLSEERMKRASMPTKLAEFLATGVRPIQFGCNSEVGDWVERTGSGLRFADLNDATLEAAAQEIAAASLDEAQLRQAREIALAHFGLDVAIRNYAGLIETILHGAVQS